MSRLPGNRAWPVLRGRGRGNASPLPDEIFFSVVQRKVVTPNDFTDLDQVQRRLTDFERRYNATAQPFRWKFTTTDLDDLLTRLDRHTPDHQEQPAIPQAA